MANQADQIHQAVCATIRDEVERLRCFLDRRVAELSAEVHATVQLMTFSEANLSAQLADIRRQVEAMLARAAPGQAGQPAGDAARGQRFIPQHAPVQGGASRAPSGPAAARAGFGSRLAMQAIDEHPSEPADSTPLIRSP